MVLQKLGDELQELCNKICTHLSLGLCSSCTTTNETQLVTKERKLVKQATDGERRWGYTTDLFLYDDAWKINKVLKESDLGNMSRLLLGKELTEDLVLPVVGDAANERGIQVRVFDVDTNSMHSLIFKIWVSSKSYVFMEKWVKDFVARRDLKKGDVIGLHWDSYNNHFFVVLHHH